MIEKPQDSSVPPSTFQIDLSEAFNQQVEFQIRILRSAINSLKQANDMPPMPEIKPPSFSTS